MILASTHAFHVKLGDLSAWVAAAATYLTLLYLILSRRRDARRAGRRLANLVVQRRETVGQQVQGSMDIYTELALMNLGPSPISDVELQVVPPPGQAPLGVPPSRFAFLASHTELVAEVGRAGTGMAAWEKAQLSVSFVDTDGQVWQKVGDEAVRRAGRKVRRERRGTGTADRYVNGDAAFSVRPVA